MDFDLALIADALTCPVIAHTIALVGILLALVVGLINSRRITTIARTPALKDHLRKVKK